MGFRGRERDGKGHGAKENGLTLPVPSFFSRLVDGLRHVVGGFGPAGVLSVRVKK